MAYNTTHRLSGNNKAAKMFGWKVSEMKLEVPTVFCAFLPLRFECVGRLQSSMLHLHVLQLMVSLTLLREFVWTVPMSCFCCCWLVVVVLLLFVCCCCLFVVVVLCVLHYNIT